MKLSGSSIRNKTDIIQFFQEIVFFTDDANLAKPIFINERVDTYLKKNKQEVDNKKKTNNKQLIQQKKREYQKLESEGSEWEISTPGCFIGKSTRGIEIRSEGKILNKKPSQALKHIIIRGDGISLSSNAVAHCMEQSITLDFFDNQGHHYATLLSPVSMDGLLWQQQSLLADDKKAALAGHIILGKMKNQENLIKYYNKYHKGALENLIKNTTR